MIKKLLLIPLMWIISFGAFASADSIDISYSNNSFVPDSITLSSSMVADSLTFSNANCSAEWDWGSCCFKIWSLEVSKFNSEDHLRIQWPASLSAWTYNLSSCNSNIPFSSITLSSDSIDNPTPVVPDDSENWWSYVPWIPDTFTSWLTNLLNNFWSTIFNWLPTIILVALWIYAIFALFRAVRWYARSSFNW